MDEVLWQLEGVELAVARGRARVRDVNVTIGPGVTAVLGESGAGKTSLLNLLVGYDKPTSGRLERMNGSMNSLGVSHGLSMYWGPQSGGLWPHLTVREHLAAVAPGSEATNDDCEVLLNGFDLTARADVKPGVLSQGERSRLTVARALASGAAVIVLDEPLAHVDEARLRRFWEVIDGWITARDMSVVFSTHQSQQVLSYAQRVICLCDGRVMFSGDVRELYENPPNEALARSLGEVNWLISEDVGNWLSGPTKAGSCYRPHELKLTAKDDGPLRVLSSRRGGAVTWTRVERMADGVEKEFVHHSSARAMLTGARVVLSWVVCVLMLLCVVGCDDEGEAVLEPVGVRAWAMPTEGPTIPAPRAIAPAWEGEMVVLDTAGRVLIFDYEGNLLRKWWMPEYDVGKAEGACLTGDGRLAVADTHYHRVVFFDRDGVVVGMWGARGEGPGEFIYPVKLTSDDAGNLYVAEYGSNDRVQKFSPGGEWLLSFGAFGTKAGEFQRPSGVVWRDGKVYVCDATNHRVQVFTDDGKFEGILTEGENPIALQFPYDMTMDAQGNLCVVEWGAGRLTWMTREGELLGRFGRAGTGAREMATPWGLAVTPGGRVWVADTGNRRLMEVWY